jgi:hypothetical protein
VFHAISAAVACLAQRARDIRAHRDIELAAVNGWQVHQVAPGVYRFRDPRFDQRTLTAAPVAARRR